MQEIKNLTVGVLALARAGGGRGQGLDSGRDRVWARGRGNARAW